MSVAEESTRRGRIAHQERAAERAVEDFEEAKKRLYRRDGAPLYGEAEHKERLESLAGELRESMEFVVGEATTDAEGYEREALGLSYQDPTATLTTTERDRLSASLPLVREDCEAMTGDELAARLSAVAAGSDKVAKVLHARYGGARAAAMDRRMQETVRGGEVVSPEDAATLRALRESVAVLEEQTRDPEQAKRREAAEEAAKRSRDLAMRLRNQRSAADGSDAAAREAHRASVISSI